MLSEIRNRISIRNIRANGLLILSAFAFLALNLQRDPQKIIAVAAALPVIVLFFAMAPDIPGRCRKLPVGIRVYALVSAAGICLYAQQSFVSRTLNALGNGQRVLLTAGSIAAALVGMIAVYALVSLLIERVSGTLKPLLRKMSGAEIAVCAAITAALAVYACYAFANSTAFWNPGTSYEVIYTSDSPSMIEPNVFLWLYHPENDLRQPLFAVFAAPLTAPAYLLSVPASMLLSGPNPGLSRMITPLLMNLMQIGLLMTANLMLTEMLGLSGKDRICFLLILAVSYMTMLFSVMIEQYIIAYFWLIFAACTHVKDGKASVIAVSAAGGTLLTSLAVMPLAYRAETDGKGLKPFLRAMVRTGLGFLMMFFALGRLDTVMGFGKKAGILASFAGGGSLSERINQYLAFITSCFAAPDAAKTVIQGHPSWQLTGQNMLHTDYAGLIILVICIISIVINRRDRAARIAGAWIGFSALLLLAVGWGAPENGMILYTLYFGWAFAVLLFRLLQRAAEKLKFGLLTPLVTCTIVVLLGWINFRGIGELLAFAFSCYPG